MTTNIPAQSPAEAEHTQSDRPLATSVLVHPAFVTAEAVYGTILVGGLIAATSLHGETLWSTLITVFSTVVIFWAAHVFAETVANHGVRGGRVVRLGEALSGGLRKSLGLLASSLVPTVILLLGALRVVPDEAAVTLALWSTVLVLGALGYAAFFDRGRPWYVCVAGSAVTALFGVAMVVLNALVH